MKDQLLNRIDPFKKISGDERNALLDILKEKEIQKGTCILKPGNKALNIYFILRGAFRSYDIRDGEEITDYFFFENSFASDYASLYSGEPTRFYLEAIEDTIAISYDRNELLALAKKYPIFEMFARIHAEQAFLEIEERMRLLQSETLDSKYQYMLNKFPELFQRD